jgi:predicted ABC-type ATPase
MPESSPHIIAVAGPNGAGKTSRAPNILRDMFGLIEYVNADTIAQGLSAFGSEAVAFDAGRAMLKRLHKLADARESFAFETTLSGRAYLPWIRRQKDQGYEFHVMYFWLRSQELAIQRVAQRVRAGGHNVSIEVIRRRYIIGARNFLKLYQPLANSWGVYDNSVSHNPRLIAVGGESSTTAVFNEEVWQQFCEAAK